MESGLVGLDNEKPMHITCKQQDLGKALSIAGHAISSRSALPILANVLLTTDQGHLKLSATNLEIGITCWIDADVLEEGITTIPAKLLSDLVSSLPSANVDLTVGESHTIQIKSQRSSATIRGMEPSEFPRIPMTDGEAPVTLDACQLKELIGQVTFAAANDDTRPVLTGIHVAVSNEMLTFAAADAFRLAIRKDTLLGASDLPFLLIPARTLNELARILPNEGSVQMVVTPNRSQVLFHTEQIDLVSRLIEGTFPNFRAIIPQEYTTRAVVETKEFAAAVKSVAPFARGSSNITLVKISGSTVTIEATAEDIGSNISTIAAAVDGPEQEIIFNVQYLSEILAAIDTSETAIELISKAKPGVLKPVGGPDAVYVVMPMSANR